MINFYNPNVRSKRTYEDVSAYTDAIKMISDHGCGRDRLGRSPQ